MSADANSVVHPRLKPKPGPSARPAMTSRKKISLDAGGSRAEWTHRRAERGEHAEQRERLRVETAFGEVGQHDGRAPAGATRRRSPARCCSTPSVDPRLVKNGHANATTPKTEAIASATVVRNPMRTAVAGALIGRPAWVHRRSAIPEHAGATQLLDREPGPRCNDLRDLRRERGRRHDHGVGGPVGHDLAFRHHHDAVRALPRRTRRRAWRPRSRARRPASVAQDRDRARAWRSSRARASARRAARTFGVAASCTASTSARRCPSERSRGCVASAIPGAMRSSVRARAPGNGARLRIGARELLADGVEIEQIRGRVRHQPDQRARLGRAEVGRGRAPPRRPGRRARAPEPWSAHSSDDFPAPLRPMSATISPASNSMSTSRTATTGP